MGVSAVNRFLNSLPLRYGALIVSVVVFGASLYTQTTAGKGLWWLIASAVLVLVGLASLKVR